MMKLYGRHPTPQAGKTFRGMSKRERRAQLGMFAPAHQPERIGKILRRVLQTIEDRTDKKGCSAA